MFFANRQSLFVSSKLHMQESTDTFLLLRHCSKRFQEEPQGKRLTVKCMSQQPKGYHNHKQYTSPSKQWSSLQRMWKVVARCLKEVCYHEVRKGSKVGKEKINIQRKVMKREDQRGESGHLFLSCMHKKDTGHQPSVLH